MLALSKSEGFRSTITPSPSPSPDFSPLPPTSVDSVHRVYPDRVGVLKSTLAPATGMPKPGRNLPLLARPVTLVEATLTQPPVNVDSKQLIDNLSPLDATLTKNREGYFLGSSAAPKNPPAFDPPAQRTATPATPIPSCNCAHFPSHRGVYTPHPLIFAFPFSSFALPSRHSSLAVQIETKRICRLCVSRQ